MLASVLTALIALTVSSASAQSVCSSAQYRSLACLASNTDAAGYCTSNLATATASTTVTTTTISTVTYSTSMDAAQPATVNSTSTESTTLTITTGDPTTVTSVATSVYSFNTTVTTYVAPAAASVARLSRKQCTPSIALASLTAMPNATLTAACDCINAPASTTTSTSIITKAVVSTITEVEGAAPTTTQYFLSRVTYTITVDPVPETMTLSTTTSVTATSTLSLAAPTYTRVFGPRAGCADIAVGPAQQLDGSVTDMDTAVDMCQDVCDQEPTCAFVYVQHMFTDYGGASPYYECYMNDHQLNRTTDLECGKRTGIYGFARGFDVSARGTA